MRLDNKRRYPDGFIKRTVAPVVRSPLQTLSNQDLADAAKQRRDLLYARRIRRASRITIVAAKNDLTAKVLQKKKRLLAIRNSLRTVRQNSLRVSAVGLLCVFTVTSLFLPLIQADNDDVLELNAATKKLVGETREDAAQYLTYDEKAKAYTFAAPSQDKSDSYEHTGRNADAYDVRLPEKASEGVTVTENNSKIAVTLTPKFFTTPAKKTTDNNLIYQSGNRQLVYTLKYNGLKEDIILPEFQGDSQQFAFRLSLPAGVEARLDQDGNIGIYSAEVSLFGDISFGSDDDRARVEKAREMGEKNNLVLTIPFPVIKDAKGNEYSDRSNFVLEDHQVEKRSVKDPKLPDDVPASISTFNTYSLAVKAYNLKPLAYPISIDPTIKVSSSTDFYESSFANGVDIDNTNNLIKRSKLTGASVGTWATDTKTAPNAATSVTVSYGKYLYYMVSGGTRYTTVYDAPVSGSMISGWVATTNVPVGPANGFVAYNGYMYVVQGDGNRRAYHAKINENGSLGSWVTGTTNFSPDRDLFGVTAYNGFLYVIGGSHMQSNFPAPDTEVNDTEVNYAPINADGSVGTWNTTSSLNFGRRYAAAHAYNGYLYVSNGASDNAAPNQYNEIEYAAINANGTLGAWTVSSNRSTSSHPGAAGRIYNGYMYMWGAWDNGSIVEYAQINADGSIGKWYATTSFTTGRGGMHGGIIVNDYIFVIGGSNGGSSSEYDDIQYAKINPPGHTTNWTTVTNQFTSGRSHAGSVAYNGYLYVSGGSSAADDPSTAVATVQYAPLSTDGSIGAWASATSFADKRIYHDMVAYNGYMYIVGGQTHNGLLPVWLNDVQYAKINTSGTLDAWTTTHTFDTVRGEHATLAHDGYLYIFGGRGGQTNIEVYQDVQKATIGANGALSVDFSTIGVPQLPGKRLRMNATVNAGRIYIVAGCVSIDNGPCDNADDDVLFTDPLSATGTYTGWTTATYGVGSPGDPDATYDYGHPVVVNGMMYLSGGHGGFQGTHFAPLNPTTGQPGEWARSSLVTYRGDWATTSYRGFIYMVGGAGSRSISYAHANNGGNGSLANWGSTSSMNTPRINNGVAVVNGYMYAIGGCITTNTCSSVTASVEKAAINPNGTLGAWDSTGVAALPAARHSMSVAARGSYIYITGGCTSCGLANNDVYVGVVNSSGGISTWTAQTGFTTARRAHGSTINGNFLYVVGGTGTSGPLSDVQVAAIGSNGTLNSPNLAGCGGATWCTTTSLPGVRTNFPITSHDGYIYVLGGCSDISNCNVNIVSTTYSSKINADGSIQNWERTTDVSQAAHSRKAVVLNGFIYLSGGFPVFDVEYAPILTGGKVGAWQTTQTPNPMNSVNTLVAGGNIYSIGGYNGNAMTNVNKASIHSIQRKGTFTKLYDFGEGVKPTKLITRGTKTSSSVTSISYSSTNNTANTLGNTQTAPDITYGGANNHTISLGSNRTLSRYLVLAYTLDDSSSATFPDSGNESYITDFDLYFTANPDSRLRGGRTFTEGADRGLDTAPQ